MDHPFPHLTCWTFFSILFGSSTSIFQNHLSRKCDTFELLESNFLAIQPFFFDETWTYGQCCHLCASTDKCASFNYNVKTHDCSLLSESSDVTELTPSHFYINGKMVKMGTQATKSKCRTRPCESDQVCVTTTSGEGYVCLQGSACSVAPPIVHMTSDMVPVSLTSGQANYTCDTGYERESDSGHSVCDDDSGWISPTLVCKKIDCGPPPPHDHKSATSVTSTLYLDHAEYTCDTGYNRTDGCGSSSCQADGTWSKPTLQCEAVDCGMPPDVINMDKGIVSGTTYMSQVTFTCSTGFTSDGGDPTIKCMADEKWSELTLVCNRKDCGRPPPKSAMEVKVTSTLYESEALYECAVGFDATGGSGTSKCEADGSWTEPSLICERAGCGTPPVIENMRVVSVQGTTHQSTAKYECAGGYNPKNTKKTSTCQADGTWSSPSLTCTIVNCGTPPDSSIHDVTFVDTTYQSTAVYQCGLGYYIQGNGTSVCEVDGQWSPTCQSIPNLRGTKTLPGSSNVALQCRNVMSTPVNYPSPNDIRSVRCAADEILTGCSASIANSLSTIYGSWIWDEVECGTRTTMGAQSVARCCKIPGLQCEYIMVESASLSCYKGFQLLDCACWRWQGTCDSTMTNNTCEQGSTARMNRYAACCTYNNLICYVKEVLGSEIPESLEMTITCGLGETMTACSGFNTGREIQKALIEDRSGVDTCIILPGQGSFSTLKGYVSCCKYKSSSG